ncbi:ABC transporter permease [Nocardioides caldifontis]|uniref:ABC transporter permease n=1 Tax=Nocardioides caldifontis TaxID=2588938 RepID=UPI001EF0B8F9|nr:ABC transporter permease [Nocardioides caldifontis]
MIRVPVPHTVDPATVPDAPLAPPGANGGLLDVFRRRYLLRLLVRKEIQGRYSGSFLGLFWSYVQPAVRFAMYFFVIGGILGLHDEVEVFGVHMFAGIVFVHFFTESFNAGTRSIIKNKALVRKMAMPREMFPVASMLVSAFHVVPGLVILTVACVAVGWTPDLVGVMAGLLGFVICAVLGTALALLFSAANVFFRDFGNVVNTLTIFVTFSVPMIYPYSMVEQRFRDFADYYLLNPLAEVVLLVQRCFWVGTTDDPTETIEHHIPDHLFLIGFGHLAAALVVLVVAQLVFTRLENKFAERL